ncbi:hypothetical protein SAMN04489732_101492 [Amycolatopsis saalfeldensis]|uniref:Uncharacterized protein n=1 Tax=Amycolatopsis saalfeldensis TaxID=394193 RepID=A0A1H8QTW3_9PSEU|nr:hypothetical protein SAMN04489732_101492 [Amycolatopsis saalfeldensis]
MRTGDSGTYRRISSAHASPSAAEPQNSTCQSVFCATTAASGRPIAPPTPSVALIREIAPLTRAAGSSSRMMLIPKGITPIAQPWSPRPATISASELVSAESTEPATSTARLASSTRRLP